MKFYINLSFGILMLFSSCNLEHEQEKQTRDILSNSSIVNSSSPTIIKTDLSGKWVLKNETPNDSILSFFPMGIVNDSSIINGSVFEFKPSNVLLQDEIYNIVPSCGTGILYFDSCSWAKVGDDIEILFKGGYYTHGEFKYKNLYQIEFDNNHLILTKKKSIIDEWKNLEDILNKNDSNIKITTVPKSK